MSEKEMIGGCNVCGEEVCPAENVLVYCDGDSCPVGVHQDCYGVQQIPEGNWYCRPCELSVKSPKCILCPSTAGAFKPTSTKKWAHVICALFFDEVHFGDDVIMEPIILDSLEPQAFKRTCTFCKTATDASYGACVTCAYPNCKVAFHVTCGQVEGLLVERTVRVSKTVEKNSYLAFCPTHVSRSAENWSKADQTAQVRILPKFKPPAKYMPANTNFHESSHNHKTSSLNLSSSSTSSSASSSPVSSSAMKKFSSGRSATREKTDREHAHKKDASSRNSTKGTTKKSSSSLASSGSSHLNALSSVQTNGYTNGAGTPQPNSANSTLLMAKSTSTKVHAHLEGNGNSHKSTSSHKAKGQFNLSDSTLAANLSSSKLAKLDKSSAMFDSCVKQQIISSPSAISTNQPPRKRELSESESESSSKSGSSSDDSESESGSESSGSSASSSSQRSTPKKNGGRPSSTSGSSSSSSGSSQSSSESDGESGKRPKKRVQTITTVSSSSADRKASKKARSLTLKSSNESACKKSAAKQSQNKKVKQQDSSSSSNNNTSSESLNALLNDMQAAKAAKAEVSIDKPKPTKTHHKRDKSSTSVITKRNASVESKPPTSTVLASSDSILSAISAVVASASTEAKKDFSFSHLMLSEQSEDEAVEEQQLKSVRKPHKVAKLSSGGEATVRPKKPSSASNRPSKKASRSHQSDSSAECSTEDEMKSDSDTSDEDGEKQHGETDDEFVVKKKKKRDTKKSATTCEKKPKSPAKSRTTSSSGSRSKSSISAVEESKLRAAGRKRSPAKKEPVHGSGTGASRSKHPNQYVSLGAEPPASAVSTDRRRNSAAARSPVRRRSKGATYEARSERSTMEENQACAGDESDSNTMLSPMHSVEPQKGPFSEVLHHHTRMSPNLDEDSMMSVTSPQAYYNRSFVMSPRSKRKNNASEKSNLNIIIPPSTASNVLSSARNLNSPPPTTPSGLPPLPPHLEDPPTPKSLEDLLDFQRVNTAHFILDQEENHDIAKLLQKFNSIMSENAQLERSMRMLTEQHTNLVSINDRLKNLVVNDPYLIAQQRSQDALASEANSNNNNNSSNQPSADATPTAPSRPSSQSSSSMQPSNATSSLFNGNYSASTTVAHSDGAVSAAPLITPVTSVPALTFSTALSTSNSSSNHLRSLAPLPSENTSLTNILATTNSHFINHQSSASTPSTFSNNSSSSYLYSSNLEAPGNVQNEATPASSRTRQRDIPPVVGSTYPAVTSSIFSSYLNDKSTASSATPQQQTHLSSQENSSQLSNHNPHMTTAHTTTVGASAHSNTTSTPFLSQLMATSTNVHLQHPSQQHFMGASSYEQQIGPNSASGARQVPLTRRNSGNLATPYSHHSSMSNGIGSTSSVASSGSRQSYGNTNGGPNGGQSHYYNQR